MSEQQPATTGQRQQNTPRVLVIFFGMVAGVLLGVPAAPILGAVVTVLSRLFFGDFATLRGEPITWEGTAWLGFIIYGVFLLPVTTVIGGGVGAGIAVMREMRKKS